MDVQKRKRITKADRLQVFNKYGGRCAYCGREMEIKEMQVDHMIPLRAGGADEMCNYMPACRRCNHYKRGSSLEVFREMVEKIPQKLWRDSYIFRVGVDYGFFESNEKVVVFYFERQAITYRCIEEFEIAEVNKNGIGTGSYFRVEADSLWSLKKRINCIGGQNHLKCEDLLMGSRWITISDEALARFFESEGGDMT